MLEAHARLTTSEVLDKLEAWLDATAKRLKRQNQAYPHPWDAHSAGRRYRVDGTVWAC